MVPIKVETRPQEPTANERPNGTATLSRVLPPELPDCRHACRKLGAGFGSMMMGLPKYLLVFEDHRARLLESYVLPPARGSS
jgi:hypothetical protein